ncbi:MAG: hypothetical protein QOF51_3247 [Chloroflexota bacterium]|jgi:hypothetical protein|nr:hypothetical protein [Chloroflexota bacterium]
MRCSPNEMTSSLYYILEVNLERHRVLQGRIEANQGSNLLLPRD